MLNSASGVVFPSPIVPPISTICSIRSTRSWCRRSSSATFVSGPVGISVTGRGCSASSRAISSTACTSSSGTLSPDGISVPSSADSPWTSSAIRGGATSGAGAPAAIGTPRIPASSHVARAFAVVRSSVPFPATVVIASSSIAGCAAASTIASMSSCPGSQSRITGVAGTPGTLPAPRVDARARTRRYSADALEPRRRHGRLEHRATRGRRGLRARRPLRRRGAHPHGVLRRRGRQRRLGSRAPRPTPSACSPSPRRRPRRAACGTPPRCRRATPPRSSSSLAERHGVDMLVVGSVGMQRRVLGSVPNTVTHKATCHVFVVKTD